MPILDYITLLKANGSFVQLGNPEDGALSIPAGALIVKRIKFAGSMVGSPSEIKEMLELAAEKKVHSWIQEVPMKDANKAIVDMEEGKARYRYVLTNEQ